VGAEVLEPDARAGLEDKNGGHGFAPYGVWETDDSDVADLGHRAEGILDFRRIHVLASCDDGVRDTAAHE